MKEWIVPLIVTGLIWGGASLWIIRRYKKYMQDMTDSLLQALDRAISGHIQDTAFDESMNSAITERLNRMVQIWSRQRDTAQEERDTVKALISDISHQVRTPLSNILIYSHLLKEQPLDKESSLLAGKIQKHSEKLEFFMKELVKSSCAEKAFITLQPERLDAKVLIAMACQAAELGALKKKILIKTKAPEGEILCYADKKWTVEALENVLENAVKYSPEGSVITIEIKIYESFVCMTVRDQGIGIREEEQGRIFERFFRSKDVKDQPGFGIGLYLAREVLSKQGGYMKVRSRYGEGTEMFVYLSRYSL